jgi:hypothetical protein
MRVRAFQFVLVIFSQWSMIICPLHLHDISPWLTTDALYYDCLYYYTRKRAAVYQEVAQAIDEFIPYCVRPTNACYVSFLTTERPNGANVSFDQLALANLTIEQSLAWSVSIDAAER